MRTIVMKSSHSGLFRDEVATISSWFDQWNPCEQTVALYSLLKKLGPVQGRFLGLCLSQQSSQTTKDIRINEQNANDPSFVRGLDGASQLVLHLPLLRPGNESAKRVYLEQIPRALSAAVDSGLEVEEARQLLSYALIHPALGNEERRALGMWLHHIEQCIASPQMTLESTNNNVNVDPAMKEVTSWLKTLRLHKYSSLLMSMGYDQMLQLTEDQLEACGVTQGARNKLILNIKKLQQRQAHLQSMHKDIDCGNIDLKPIFDDIRAMLVTPMKSYPAGPMIQDGDVPSEITRLMGKICSTLLTSHLLDNGIIAAYVQLIDRCVAHEQFCSTLKSRLNSWKVQVTRFGTRRRPFTLPWIGKDLPCPVRRSTNTLPFGNRAPNIMDPEYEDRLESLCLSMTEHAIGDTFNN